MSKKSENKGLFVAMKLAADTLVGVKKLMKDLKLKDPIPDDDLHVTTMYSLKSVPKFKVDPDFRACSDEPEFELAVMGEGEFRALVLKFKSQALQERHEEIKDMGAVFTFSNYSPHLSLSYNVNEKNLRNGATKSKFRIKNPSFRICLTKEFFDVIEGFD